MSKEQLDVVGIGNAIVDVLARSEDAFLQNNGIHKGAMTLIDLAQTEALYAKMGPAMEMSGGSAANTIAAFASLGGAGGYIGKVAGDQLGHVFGHDIRASGVEYATAPLTGGAPTARCMIFVTPDAQRTMCTYLGACTQLTVADVDADLIGRAQVTYLEGYLFDPEHAKEAFRHAADVAHAAGRKVALSLSDPFCVGRHHAEFLAFVEKHVDILFANEAEIEALYNGGKPQCDLAVVTHGAKGSQIITPQGTIEVKAEPVAQVVDTTGAGDLYAAGFLYGYTRGKPLAECGRIGSIAAGEIIAQLGARPQRSLAQLLKEKKAA